MASKKKVITGEERLKRSCSIRMGIIRGLIRGLEFAEDRVLCDNWLSFLSESAKDQPRTCSGLLEQMERQLREMGHLSKPFNAHVYCRTDLRVLLDEARRLHSSLPEVVAPNTSAASPSRGSSFVWRQRVRHLSALEEQYRRKKIEQRLNSKPKKVTAIKEVGVQVEPPRREGDVSGRLPKKLEMKERLIRDNLQRVAEQRQLDLQRKAEARQLREQRLLEQRLKVQEQRDHERNMMNKKREAPSHRTMGLSRRQKQDEAKVEQVSRGRAKELKKPEALQKSYKAPLPSAGNCVRCEIYDRQAAMRAEIVKQKETDYEQLKQYHHKRALEERARLKKERLDREKAEQGRKTKQGRATGGLDELPRQGKDTIRNVCGRKEHKKKQEELKKKAPDESERRQRDDLQGKSQKQREKERDQIRKQELLDEKEKAQEKAESERRQRDDLQKKSQRQRQAREESEQRLREDLQEQIEEQTIFESRRDLLVIKRKLLQLKLSQLQEKYKKPPEGLTVEQELEFRKREVKDIKELLKEATEHKMEIRKALEALKEDRQKSEEGEPTTVPCVAVQAYLEIQKEKDRLTQRIRERCQEIEKKLLAGAPNRDPDYWENWAQELRGKCLQELRNIEAVLNKYSPATLENEDDESLGDDPSRRDTYRSHREVNDLAPRASTLQGASSLELLYMREPWADSNSVYDAGEPRINAGESIVSFCTVTCRKRFSNIGQRGRKEVSLNRGAFGQLLKGSGSTELKPKVLAAQNRILERKLAVAKTITLNKYIQKSLILKAGRLIDVLVYEKAKSHLKPPRHFFQALLSPLLQDMANVSPRVLEAIASLDNKLEAYLESLFEGQAVDQINNINDIYDQTVQQLRAQCNKQHLVSELLIGFYDEHPKLPEILQAIDQLYRMWKDQRLDEQYKP
nr:trichohyalin [Drosophila kikkawai]